MPDQPFVHLHLHSEYSLLDGACHTKEIPKRAAALGMSAVAVTDHGNMHSTIEFYRACLEAGVKPIIGLETYVCDHSRLEKRDGKAHSGHMVLLARNNTGYQNLLKLATKASLEGFYYHPRVDHELLKEHAEGIIALTACLGGEIPKLIRSGDLEKAKTLCCWYQELFGRDGFYLELQDHNTPERQLYPEQPTLNAALREISRELGIPLVATNDVHFMNKDDFDAHEVLICIGTQTTVEEYRAKGMSYSTEHYMKSPEEMYAYFPDDAEALENSARIAELCDVTIELDNPQLPQYEVPAGETWDSYLRQICDTQLQHVYRDDSAMRTTAAERLDYELEVISKKGLSAYFLIVRDFLQWARDQGMLVGIRGSGAGAIVSYLTGISTLDPIEYGLWFERFLSVDRATMPDIDCDFEDRRRGEVIEYVVQKYGVDRVAQVATFGTLQPRLAVRDAARAMGIPLTTADRLSKAIGMAKSIQVAIEENPQIREWYETEPITQQLLNMAIKLQGLSRHVGTHAAAVVISKDPLVEIAPLQRTADGIGIQTQWEYPMAEAAGLVKMDFLGLRTLTVLKDALNYIEQNHGKSYDLANLPLDDARAYELMAHGDTAGVFQLESVGMRNALRQLRPDRITDVIAMVALYRPGPMAEIPKFCQGKHEPSTITYLHASLEPILKETYGVLVYQEQVMAIGRDIAGLNMVDSNNLLNALRKKQIEKMDKLEPVFKKGTKETSKFTDGQADALWDRLKEFAKYAFNKAHSACYAIVAYQTAFLKANYPVEFIAALLTSVADSQDKISLYVAESRKLGIEVLPPSVNASRNGFTIEGGKIRFGMTAIKGVGSGAVEAVVAAREADGPFADLFDFCCRVEPTICNRLALEALIKCGAMDTLPGNRAQKLAILDNAIDMGQSAARDKAAGQISLFGAIAESVQVIAQELPPLPEYPAQQLLGMEREYLGLYISDHPINAHMEVLTEYRTASVEELAEARSGEEVIIGGMLTSVKPYTTKTGKQMGFLSLDDLTGVIEITAFADVYDKYNQYLQTDKILLVKGTVDFGVGRSNNAPTGDEEEKPEPKLLAIALAPVEDAEAIRELQKASPRRRNGYGNGNGNGFGRNNGAPGVSLPIYQPTYQQQPVTTTPDPVEDEMGEFQYTDIPPEETAPVAEISAGACRICLTAAFVNSEDFEKLSSILQSCKGEAEVEIAVSLPAGGKRRWSVPNLRVNTPRVAQFIRVLPGAQLDA
ncbi:MAG: DNA polymerase III subunit alpha [Armatimonadota bacterium]